MTCRCGRILQQKPRGRSRLHCSTRCRKAAWRSHTDRSAEYRADWIRRGGGPALPPLAPLFPDMFHHPTIAYWSEELRMELRQERVLAELEGRDPEAAVAAYRARETNWEHMTTTGVWE